MKRNRNEVNLAAVKILSKLACQELDPFSTDKTLTLPQPFIVETGTYNLHEKKNDNQLKKFLWSCIRWNTDTTEIDLPTWARTQALLSESELPYQNFHTAKCVQRCIGKYIKGTGLKNALVETGVPELKWWNQF